MGVAKPEGPVIASWQQGVWIWASGGLGFIGLLLCIFVAYTVGQVAAMISSEGAKDLNFAFAAMTLLILTLLRLLAILVGAGMIFGGLAVSFYTHAQASQVAGEGAGGIKGSLATSSPGIAAIVVGAVVILAALFSKGEYRYDPPSYQIVSGDELAAMHGARSGEKGTAAAPAASAATRPFRTASEILNSGGSTQ